MKSMARRKGRVFLQLILSSACKWIVLSLINCLVLEISSLDERVERKNTFNCLLWEKAGGAWPLPPPPPNDSCLSCIRKWDESRSRPNRSFVIESLNILHYIGCPGISYMYYSLHYMMLKWIWTKKLDLSKYQLKISFITEGEVDYFPCNNQTARGSVLEFLLEWFTINVN